jgi:hypothetical protein
MMNGSSCFLGGSNGTADGAAEKCCWPRSWEGHDFTSCGETPDRGKSGKGTTFSRAIVWQSSSASAAEESFLAPSKKPTAGAKARFP